MSTPLDYSKILKLYSNPIVKPIVNPIVKPIVKPIIKQKPVEQKPIEQKPIEQKRIERKRVEQEPSEQKPKKTKAEVREEEEFKKANEENFKRVKAKCLDEKMEWDLSFCRMGDEEIKFVTCQLNHMDNQIVKLNLTSTARDTSDYKGESYRVLYVRLFKVLQRHKFIKSLIFDNNILDQDLCNALASLIQKNSNIAELSLNSCSISDSRNLITLLQSKHNIQSLDLRGIKFSESFRKSEIDTASVLKEIVLCSVNVEKLHLGFHDDNHRRELKMKQVLRVIKNPKLKSLYLEHLNIDDGDVPELIEILKRCKELKKLKLNGNRLGIAGINKFFEYLVGVNLPLRHLNLRFNSLWEDKVLKIPVVSIYQRNTFVNLETLLIKSNGKYEGAQSINKSLTRFELYDNNFSEVMSLHRKNKKIMMMVYLMIKHCAEKFPIPKAVVNHILLLWLY